MHTQPAFYFLYVNGFEPGLGGGEVVEDAHLDAEVFDAAGHGFDGYGVEIVGGLYERYDLEAAFFGAGHEVVLHIVLIVFADEDHVCEVGQYFGCVVFDEDFEHVFGPFPEFVLRCVTGPVHAYIAARVVVVDVVALGACACVHKGLYMRRFCTGYKQ